MDRKKETEPRLRPTIELKQIFGRGVSEKAGELRLKVEARLGELIKQEQEAGRLATKGRPNKPSNVGRLKDYGLTKKCVFGL